MIDKFYHVIMNARRTYVLRVAFVFDDPYLQYFVLEWGRGGGAGGGGGRGRVPPTDIDPL